MTMTRRTFALTGAASLMAPAAIAQGAQGYAQTAAGLDQLHALVVRQGGEDLLAEAYRGGGLSQVANVKSVSKTLVALLTGIAIEKGHLSGVDQAVLPLLGRAETGDALDDLTIGDLLSMRAGLASTSGGNYGTWVSSGDWVDSCWLGDLVRRARRAVHLFDRRLARSGSGLSQVIGQACWHVAGMARASARVDIAPWVRDPQGRYLGGNDMG